MIQKRNFEFFAHVIFEKLFNVTQNFSFFQNCPFSGKCPTLKFRISSSKFSKIAMAKNSNFHYLGPFLTLSNMVTKILRKFVDFFEFSGIKSDINLFEPKFFNHDFERQKLSKKTIIWIFLTTQFSKFS